MDHASLSKLNVAKLKEKCKELKITGYSKLSKPLLIEKLLSAASSTVAKGGAVNASTPSGIAGLSTNAISNNLLNRPEQVQSILESTQPQIEGNLTTEPTANTRKRAGKNKVEKEPAKKRKKGNKTTVAGVSDPLVSDSGGALRDNPTPSNDANNQALGDIRRESSVITHPPATSNSRLANGSASRAPLAPLQPTQTQSTATELIRPAPTIVPSKPKAPSLKPPRSTIPSVSPPAPRTPIQPTAQAQPTPNLPRIPQTYKPKTFKPPAIIRPHVHHNPPKPSLEPVPCPEQSLDFSPPEICTSFPLISMPPSTARRRQAERMSVVFSGIADSQVLRICVRVSRAWRYAVYLSATHTLYRDFSGTRLDTIRLQIKEPRMTNMWNYLCARRLEVSSRYDAFRRSWLGRFFATEMSGHEPISWRIWSSADDDRQITVALRFISTRVVFSLARRYNECDQNWVNLADKVVGAEEIIPGEVWKVTTAWPAGRLGSFHILYDTGEVIGLAPPPPRQGIIGHRIKHRPHIEVLDSEPGELRADWREYILSAGAGPNLQDLITSADRESYVAGVSAFWLRNLSLEESTRRVVAKRYVLSCVEPNSLSGEYKSVMDMVGDVAGVASGRKSRHRLGLYISEHHLVESVHIPSSLHPALAMVVTAPGREYFVLRDTGTPIGTSDQGLEPLWKRLIGCDAWGSWCAYTARAIG
ncbi:unnamed protein product [Rhizoctonia solani]|uniref:Rho termination factor N-terminal domain-containing protein n=1 Tax=Rhizoctonia solani TaxID=456999 RepID=A0A8H3CWM8_9AGAM|nr:unnamed protein product [Rhizoctonia solani]